MPKIYKIAMFVLLGFGALLVVSGISLFSEDTAAAIFGIVFGLIVALPMVVLYKPLSDKRKAAARRAEEEKERKKQEAAARADAERKAKREAWERTHKKVYAEVDSIKPTAMRKHYQKRNDVTANVTELQPYEKDGALRYAVLMDGEKVGDVIADAPALREYADIAKSAYCDPMFSEEFDEQEGDTYIACTLTVTFEVAE